MGLPSCSEQRAGDGAPQLGAGDPLGIGEWHALSGKELQSMVDDPVKGGLCPGDSSAKLFQDHRGHSLVQCLWVVAISLATRPAFGLFFSGKFFGYVELWGTVWILTSNHNSDPWGSMMWTSTRWMGRTLPGAGWPSGMSWSGMSMVCSVVAVRPACRASLLIRSLMRSCLLVWRPLVQHAACLPKGFRMCVHCLPPPRARGRVSQSLAQPESKNRISLAGQAVEPLTMSMISVGLRWVVAWMIAKPLVSKRVIQVHSPLPQVAHRFGVNRSRELTTVAEAEPCKCFKQVSCLGDVQEAGRLLVGQGFL